MIQCLSKSSNYRLILFSPKLKNSVFKNLPERVKKITISAPFSNIKRLLGPSKKHHLDIYHGLSNELPLLKHSKMIVTIHDLIFKSHPKYYKRIDRWIYHLKTKNAIKQADLIICTSQQTADALDFYYPNKKSKKVVYQHCSWEKVEVSTPLIQKDYILYVSSFEGRKNHLNLLKAFKEVAQETNHALLLVGRPKETLKQVKEFIQANGLVNKVIIKPDAKLAEIKNYLQNAIGFIYPSLIEGFGIPLIEAMHYNLPIAASNIQVFNEIGQNQITYFDPRDVNQIKNAILDLLDIKKQKVKPQYQDLITRFSEKNHQMKLEIIYKNLIEL